MSRRSMRPGRLVVLAAAIVVAACDLGAPAPTAAPPEPPSAGYRLRATLTQALAPQELFGWVPALVITGDRVAVTAGPVPAIFPGPLLPNLRGRALSESGWIRIVDRARELGLLDGSGDFTPPRVAPGAQLGRIELVADGSTYVLTGDPALTIQCIRAPCDPPPGSPEAFGWFWQALTDLQSLVGESELGEDLAYRPDGYALLIGVQPPDPSGIGPDVATWPLERPLADIGRPIGQAALPRCGTVRGDDAAMLHDAFEEANQLTRWVDDGGAAFDAVTIQVRPLMPGEDVCAELFGIEEG